MTAPFSLALRVAERADFSGLVVVLMGPFWLSKNRLRNVARARGQHRSFVKDRLEFETRLLFDTRPGTPVLPLTPEVQWLYISDGECRAARCHISYQSAHKQTGSPYQCTFYLPQMLSGAPEAISRFRRGFCRAELLPDHGDTGPDRGSVCVVQL
jgi:hypothetical protein